MGLLGGLMESSVKELVIKLDTEGKPFIAGDDVAGTVEATTEKESLQVDSITLTVTGKTDIEFSHSTRVKQKKGGYKSVSKACKLDLDFWKENIELEKQTVLEAGTKTYNFSFKLPTFLRSSFGQEGGMFEAVKCHTRYEIKVHVDIPMGIDKTTILPIQVSHLGDLNKDNTTLEKVEEQQTKTFGALCCESGPVSLNMILNKSGFVCGEKIMITARINNSSDTKIKEVKATLFQHLKYHGSYKIAKPRKKKGNKKKAAAGTGAGNNIQKSKLATNTVSKPLIIGMVEPNDEKTFEATFDIPELPPSHKDTKAVEISYNFKLEAVPDRTTLGGDKGCTHKITIGNIPHKIAYRTWAEDNMYEVPTKVKEVYPTIPNYNGEKYVFYETAKVREDTGDATGASDKVADWDDGDKPGDESSEDDSSDSDEDDDD